MSYKTNWCAHGQREKLNSFAARELHTLSLFPRPLSIAQISSRYTAYSYAVHSCIRWFQVWAKDQLKKENNKNPTSSVFWITSPRLFIFLKDVFQNQQVCYTLLESSNLHSSQQQRSQETEHLPGMITWPQRYCLHSELILQKFTKLRHCHSVETEPWPQALVLDAQEGWPDIRIAGSMIVQCNSFLLCLHEHRCSSAVPFAVSSVAYKFLDCAFSPFLCWNVPVSHQRQRLPCGSLQQGSKQCTHQSGRTFLILR